MDTLFFIASKLIWALISPDSLLLILVLSGTVALFFKRTRVAKALLGFSCTVLVLVAFLPVGKWLLYPLESRFPVNPALPERIDGIIMLGGGVDILGSYIWNQTQLGGGADRYTVMAELARRYPQAKLVFSGGSGLVLDQAYKEADIARVFFESLGIPQDNFEYERESRNTYENAIHSKQLVKPGEDENWVLITSAFHMPRSVGIFCGQDWQVLPYPVDYYTTPGRHGRPGLNLAGNLGLLNLAIREWVGLTAYFITGKTPTYFPAGCEAANMQE